MPQKEPKTTTATATATRSLFTKHTDIILHAGPPITAAHEKTEIKTAQRQRFEQILRTDKANFKEWMLKAHGPSRLKGYAMPYPVDSLDTWLIHTFVTAKNIDSAPSQSQDLAQTPQVPVFYDSLLDQALLFLFHSNGDVRHYFTQLFEKKHYPLRFDLEAMKDLLLSFINVHFLPPLLEANRASPPFIVDPQHLLEEAIKQKLESNLTKKTESTPSWSEETRKDYKPPPGFHSILTTAHKRSSALAEIKQMYESIKIADWYGLIVHATNVTTIIAGGELGGDETAELIASLFALLKLQGVLQKKPTDIPAPYLHKAVKMLWLSCELLHNHTFNNGPILHPLIEISKALLGEEEYKKQETEAKEMIRPFLTSAEYEREKNPNLGDQWADKKLSKEHEFTRKDINRYRNNLNVLCRLALGRIPKSNFYGDWIKESRPENEAKTTATKCLQPFFSIFHSIPHSKLDWEIRAYSRSFDRLIKQTICSLEVNQENVRILRNRHSELLERIKLVRIATKSSQSLAHPLLCLERRLIKEDGQYLTRWVLPRNNHTGPTTQTSSSTPKLRNKILDWLKTKRPQEVFAAREQNIKPEVQLSKRPKQK